MPVQSLKQINPNYIQFNITDIDVSLVNALRRIILSEYPTVGFNTDDYLNSDLKIKENTSFLHNEMLLHRISLIPINADPTDWNPKKLQFSLEAENKTKEPLLITSKDFVVIDTETNEKLDSKLFFPANPITKDNIIIVVLKPNPGEEGQKISLTGVASVGIGQMHSRFCPVSKAVYEFVQDAEKVKENLDKVVSKATDKDRAALDFKLGEAERHFQVNERGEPNHFLFKLESIGVFSPQLIFNKSIDILIQKINKIQENIVKLENEDTELDDISLKINSVSINETYTLTIQNETHTVGNLICKHASILYPKEELAYIGYKNPHPLKKFIEIDITPKPFSFENSKIYLLNICEKIKDIVSTVTV